MWEIVSNFVAFLENLNFKMMNHCLEKEEEMVWFKIFYVSILELIKLVVGIDKVCMWDDMCKPSLIW